MCGIVGFFSELSDKRIITTMNETIIHRGPDAQRVESFRQDTLYFGHSRLSILDLSEAGAQPMRSKNGRYHIVYNGEIYNFKQIKSQLSREWAGHSDTEVLVEAISEWGLDKTLSKIKGMFAIALYDSQEDKLFLIRDRMGEKPLYYGHLGKTFVFASELKAIMAHPEFKNSINLSSLSAFFSYSYVPQGESIFNDVYKLKPAHFLEYCLKSGSISLKRYWDITESYSQSTSLDFDEATNRLEELIEQSIKEQMISDVPLGAFLSGGVDSSAVVALMQKNSSSRIKTFSIGFGEKKYNEAEYAKAVAAHLGTDHTELYVTPQDALNVIPKLPDIYDEPFADSSQIPTYLLSKMTSEKVKVSLSGDAGDELFGGYNRYLMAGKIQKLNKFLPGLLSRPVSEAIGLVPASIWNNLNGVGVDKIFKLRRVLGVRSENDIYDILVKHWGRDLKPLKENVHVAGNVLTSGKSFQEKMMLQDCLTYLPDDILVKVDRAAMAVSLETRVPFLDKDVVEFAMKLPLEYKINQSSKYILRQILYRYVPRNLIERPKMGFGVPIDSWMRSELREWAEDLLSEKKLEQHGLLNTSLIRSMWKQHLDKKANWQYHLWDVLMFQSWYFRYLKKF